MKHVLAAAVLCLAARLPAQDLATLAAAARIDVAIPWASDGFYAPDPGAPQPKLPPTSVDRAALLRDAVARAKTEGRPVLWYVPRIEGKHMIRGAAPDDYLRVVAFTDRFVAPMVARRFVPVRCAADAALGKTYGIVAPDWVEPALLVLDGDGKVVRRLDRIRTFNAEFFRRWLNAALVAAGGTAEPDPLDAARAESPASAAAVDGVRLLRKGDLAAAETALGAAVQAGGTLRPWALYGLAHAVLRQARDEEAEALFRRIVAEHPESPEAAQAAVNVTLRPRDTTPAGPAFHRYEDVFDPPEPLLALDAPTTARARPDAERDDVVRRAVRFLLTAQTSSGGWTDARYACCPSPRILPNVWVAVSAAAMSALRDRRAVDPAAVDAALRRGEAFLFDERNLARGHNEECYADAFRLYYLARKVRDGVDVDASRAKMTALAKELVRQQDEGGALAHEYPNPFATAAGALALGRARQAGAAIPGDVFASAAKGVASSRGESGIFAYSGGRGGPKKATDDALKNSMGRNPMCSAALVLGGAGEAAAVGDALDNFWKWMPRLERIRVCDFHTDGELGGFFFWHATFFASEAVDMLPANERGAARAKFGEAVLKIGELDGSFVDSHEVGKSYGTAMALLTLANAEAPKS